MARNFPNRGPLDLPKVALDMQSLWDVEDVFRRSVEERSEDRAFVFYEGPPSANGQPGIHHVMGRAIKDIFCRFQTLQGRRVERKAGWDTHGLPVELSVEKELGITKEDIGVTLSVEDYNDACRKTVMRYTDRWNALTRAMGYWVDMEEPYVTYKSKYIESVWWLLSQLHQRDFLYKGYTVQPFSPKAGTGLSTHELNQPGAYQDVTDTTVVAQFRLTAESAAALRECCSLETCDEAMEIAEQAIDLLAWTTTPWTLPSNTALTVGEKIDYVVVSTQNRYTDEPACVVLAEALFSKHFEGKKAPTGQIVGRLKGADLVGLRYEQLMAWALPMENAESAFQVIAGDFVTTEDGTGIVHTAPTFGADDARVAAAAGVPPMLVDDGTGEGVPLVDRQGRFIACCGDMAGRYVKNAYYADGEAPERSVDVEIAIELKTRGQAFVVEKYKHSYPHCWRTDKPILYYPLDSWFVKATAAKERMMELNKTIEWKPASTGTGRFGKWLENLNDWNLSRSRFWGIPIPIWRTEDGDQAVCIGSVEELVSACEASVAAGVMSAETWADNPLSHFAVGDMSEANYASIDLHKHRMDDIVLAAEDGRPMRREADLIDVWFDSGSMPYAQGHYPFESPERIDEGRAFPADFIAEGVDQTRGWFYTLHAISTMVFDSVAYKAVVSNGLVLDKNGIKMSKRLGNTVDPFETIDRYGPDATRWYMVTNAQPWDNLRFDVEGITEVQRKFFGTLHNTYAFFAMYAEIDGFDPDSTPIEFFSRPEIDRWILSRLQTTLDEVCQAYSNYEPTKAGRAVQRFVVEELSNWYVRQSRRRFWKSSTEDDKLSAYQTLHRCLSDVAVMASPIAPFFSDQLYRDLGGSDSVHLALWPTPRPEEQDKALESRMSLAQKMCSMALALRKKESIRVRQPLARILVPVLTESLREEILAVSALVCAEINVKRIEMLDPKSGVISKRLKADFKALGPRYGKQMKSLAAAIAGLDNDEISALEQTGSIEIQLDDIVATIHLDDVEILTNDIPGWTVLTEGPLTVALDIEIDDELRSEGLSRELVNRVQNLRKEQGFEVTDRIVLSLDGPDDFRQSVAQNIDYIRAETLADDVRWCVIEGAQLEALEPTLTVSIAVDKSK